jgi:glycogen debranching enzyme
MSDDLVKILDGNTFVVSDGRGDIEASLTDPTGLFSFDTRFLSRWVLTVDGQRLNPLSVDDLHYFETRFFLVPGTGTVYVDAKLSVIRQRAVGDGFREELTILNHDDQSVDLSVRVEAASDFADLFEVKDALEKQGKYSSRVEDGRLFLAYERGTYRRATAITSSSTLRSRAASACSRCWRSLGAGVASTPSPAEKSSSTEDGNCNRNLGRPSRLPRVGVSDVSK